MLPSTPPPLWLPLLRALLTIFFLIVRSEGASRRVALTPSYLTPKKLGLLPRRSSNAWQVAPFFNIKINN